MTREPYERHEHIEEGPHYEERVTHDVGAEAQQASFQATQFIWLIAGIVEALIALRVFLKLIAANPSNSFAQLIYGITDVLLLPFFGLTGTPSSGDVVLEIPAIIAMVVYALFFWVVAKLFQLAFMQTRARSVTTREEHGPAVHEHVAEPVVEEHVVYEEEPEVVEERVVREERVVHDHDHV